MQSILPRFVIGNIIRDDECLQICVKTCLSSTARQNFNSCWIITASNVAWELLIQDNLWVSSRGNVCAHECSQVTHQVTLTVPSDSADFTWLKARYSRMCQLGFVKSNWCTIVQLLRAFRKSASGGRGQARGFDAMLSVHDCCTGHLWHGNRECCWKLEHGYSDPEEGLCPAWHWGVRIAVNCATKNTIVVLYNFISPPSGENCL